MIQTFIRGLSKDELDFFSGHLDIASYAIQVANFYKLGGSFYLVPKLRGRIMLMEFVKCKSIKKIVWMQRWE